jgi:M6 family metalloprotease-like protein
MVGNKMHKRDALGIVFGVAALVLLMADGAGATTLLVNDTVFSSDDIIANTSIGGWVEKNNTLKQGGFGEAITGTRGNIYAIRSSSTGYSSYFWKYDTLINSWQELNKWGDLPDSSLPRPKSGTALAWDNSTYLYVMFGGANNDTNREYFYRYSVVNNTWESLNNTPFPQGAGDAMAWSGYGGYIYAIIGSNERGTAFARYKYNSWEILALNPNWTVTDDGASLVWPGEEYLYALRGEYNETAPNGDFARYNIPAQTWEDMKDIPVSEGVGKGASLLWVGEYPGYIFALSGSAANENPGYNFYCYNILTDIWEQLESVPYPIGYYVGNRLGFTNGHIYYWQGTPSTWPGGGVKFFMFEQPVITPTPTPRDVKIAVILAEPSDDSHNIIHDKNYYLTNIIPDLKDYYKEVSYGAINIILNSEDIYDNNSNWYKLGKTAVYYGRNITHTKADGTTYEDGWDNSSQFLLDVVETADLDINFSNYDAVIVLHANKSQQETGGNWDLMTTHAWMDDYTTSNGYKAKNLILNSEYELIGTWAHETGHALGRILQPSKPPFYLPDRYGDKNGNHSIGDWDLMGSGNWLGVPAGSNPDHMSSFSKDWLGWLDNKSVGYGTYWINSLATMNYGDEITRYITENNTKRNYINYYIIETRANNPAYSRWDTSAPIPYGYNNSLVLYQVDDYGKGNSTVDYIKNLIPWRGTPYADYSSYWDFASKIRFTALDERARTVGTKPLFEMEVGIDNFSIPWLVGAILEPENNLLGYVPSYSWSSPLNIKIPLPDIDLHAYTPDGKHVGMNYTTGIYENEIPGANASGDLLNGREWIFVPDNIKVQFVVDSRDNQNFLNSYPELQQITNGTQSYNLTLVYDVPDDVRYTASTEQSIQPGDVMKYNYSITRNTDGTYKVIVDDVPPIIFNTTPKNITNNSQISAEFADNPDGSGINSSSISLIIDNINVTQNATITDNSISIEPILQDGLHEIFLNVSDNAGNIAAANWNFTLDTVPPVIQLYPVNGTEFYSDQNLTIDYTVTDATSGVAASSITLDNTAVTKGDLIDLRNLSIGSHIIRVIARDNAGNRAESSITFVIKPLQAIVEIEPHTLNINSSGGWIEAKIQIPGYNASLINISSIRLNGTIPVDIKFKEIEKDEKDTVSHDNDKELKVKFNRTMVQSIISPGKVTLYISGKVNGAIFMGNDTIKVIQNLKGDDTEKEKSEEDNKNKGSGGKS